MSHQLTHEAERKLEDAVAAATAATGLRPTVSTEFLDGPDGSALHIKMQVGRPVDQATRLYLVRAATNAALAALPELASAPLVTVLQAA
ncbi:MAG: hypothetical protein HY904_00505 [Deltaproteobacteria bacterium]|nr:hypothetical protein [Deltaproteobacteria bacterium]